MLKSTKHDCTSVHKKNSKTLDLRITLIFLPLDFIFCALVLTSESYSYIIQSNNCCLKSLAFCSPVNNLDEQSPQGNSPMRKLLSPPLKRFMHIITFEMGV